MKVLMAIPVMGRGKNLAGTPSHVLKLSKALRLEGVEVCILETRGKSNNDNVSFSTNFIKMLWEIPLILIKFKPDVVHSHTHVAAVVLIPFCWLFNIKHVYECHGVPRVSLTKPIRSKILNSFEKFVINNVAGIVIQAHAMKKRIVKLSKNTKFKYLVSYPGLKVDEFSTYHGNKCYISDDLINKINVIYIGTSQPYQGLDILAESQKYLKNDNIHYSLLLSDNSAEEVSAKYPFDVRKTSIINLIDSSQLPGFLKAADILVHSRPDTIDNLNVQSKLGLYLASGRPIVATNVGDYQDILGTSEFAYITNPDGESFAVGINNVVENLTSYEKSSVLGPEVANKLFNVERNVKQLVSFYNEVCFDRIN